MGKTAAGAAISYFVNKALGRLSAEDEDLHKKLMDKLPIIEAVFDAGNQPQVWENPALAAPMWQFRDALQEAEDALDELEYMDLEKEVKDRRAREAKGWKVRLSARLPGFSSGFRRSLSVVATGGTSKRLKDALKGLDSVIDNAGNFLSVIMNIQRSSSDIQDPSITRETTRELTTTAVFGRQEEKEELLEWLVKCLEVQGLHQEDTLKLFNHHAFGNSTPSDRLELRLIGEQIARKLKGCPFVAKVVGQQLRDNTDSSRWDAILNHDIHRFDEIDLKIMEMLKMSYQNLTYEVKLCFRYCSIFPPGFKFKMEDVTEMWVASGLILQQEKGIKNQEDIARDHFNILARKSFFSLVPRELHADPSEDHYVMHDLIYELALSVSIEECSRFKDGDHRAAAHHIFPSKVQHLYIRSITSEIITIISQSKNLHTLIIENEATSIQQELMSDLRKSIKGRTSLRLLKLDGQGWFGMNDVVAELKHLRYIYMSVTDEPNLCKLFKLCHLQVLRIIKIDKEEKMNAIDISNLLNLKILDLPKRALSTIPHIGKLTNIRELNGFSVRKKDGHFITELKNLGKLRKIIVLDVQNVSNCNEADDAKLDKKLDMKVLSLRWSNGHAGIDDQILNKLVPHRNVTHLTISQYSGIKPPMWIQIRYLSNLVRLELDGCIEWDKLPPLSSLGTLEHVILAHLPNLKCIGNSSYGSNAYGYRENWTKGTAPGELPPNLVTFVVKDCPRLLELPDLPFSLQLLGIDEVGMSSLPNMSDIKRLEPQLSTLHIRSCDFLVSLNGCFLQEKYYKALTVLRLFQCRTLSSLPNAADFQRISKMKTVEIIEFKLIYKPLCPIQAFNLVGSSIID
ncbi:hypothetical protein HU200_000070 [Digitaria exilis]|uniref:Uncharacterized protein n=1 Tax=Digitaria exilis TaxID=1010633 RepID=A0A835KVX5_9POAL|nr:hypothetical protein HU200_000070 [Digitaria exilis]